MTLRAFASKAGTAHTTVMRAARAGRLIVAKGGGLDSRHPVNAAWLVAHDAPGVSRSARSRPPAASAGKAAPSPAAAASAALAAAVSGGADVGLSASELRDLARAAVWGARKDRAATARIEIQNAERLRELLPGKLIASLIGEHHQGIVANFVDSPQRQAIQICGMLGCEGKEKVVMEYLEKDNERRLQAADDTVKRIVRTMASHPRPTSNEDEPRKSKRTRRSTQ